VSRSAAPLVLAFDIGTSSLRTALFNTRGEPLEGSAAQAAYPLRYTADGGAVLAPAVLRRAALGCLQRTLASRGSGGKRGAILGVGTSCFWHSLLGVDGRNRPLTPIYTWADSRCGPDAALLRREFSEEAVNARTGCMLRASFWPAKLRWLRRVDFSLFARVSRWMSPGEWICREFAGEAVCGFSMASGTGLLDVRAATWDEAMLEACGVRSGSMNPLGEAAAKPGFPAGVPWFPAIGDGAAGNLGSGAVRPGIAAINSGTSAALRVMKSRGIPQAPFGLFCYRVDGRRYLVGGAVSNAGNLRAWCVRELRLDERKLEAEMARRPAPLHGLTILPFWTAERAPTWDETRRGGILGLSQNTTALDILQAAGEASFYRIARIAEMVLEMEKRPPRFIVSGGVERSPSSLQRLANILGRRVFTTGNQEASLRGAAVYALERLGFDVPTPPLSRAISPQPKLVRLYREARHRQLAFEAVPLAQGPPQSG